ncbi:MAG TPA: hypothetical protein VM261_08570 [Kofleriaceae bacterium]|nr:hypothetical protein [Kofleriaceae bacterium]
MCCFSGRVAHVGGTNIFARRMGARQALVYAMNVELDDAVAMILPLPIARAAEDALGFVDLSGYPSFFKDLAAAFPQPQSGGVGMAALRSAAPQSKLVVHDVGDFIASFAPSPADLDRLDARFRISPELFAARPEYRDWGFAVFQLKPRAGGATSWWPPWKRKRTQAAREQAIHPMAFTFESREPDALFFPTVHVHDGTVPAEAAFDHTLYTQIAADEALARTLAWEDSGLPSGRIVKVERTHGLVDGELSLRRQRYSSRLRNVDLWLRPAAATRPLSAAGPEWRWQCRAGSAHGMELHEETPGPRTINMRTRLDALHDAIAEGVPALVAAKAAAWKLGPMPDADEFRRYALTSRGLIDRLDEEAGKPQPCRMTVSASTDAFDAQQVDLGFTHLPSRELLATIERELSSLVARAQAQA